MHRDHVRQIHCLGSIDSTPGQGQQLVDVGRTLGDYDISLPFFKGDIGFLNRAYEHDNAWFIRIRMLSDIVYPISQLVSEREPYCLDTAIQDISQCLLRHGIRGFVQFPHKKADTDRQDVCLTILGDDGFCLLDLADEFVQSFVSACDKSETTCKRRLGRQSPTCSSCHRGHYDGRCAVCQKPMTVTTF